MTVKIVVCRHPQKDGDRITPKGAMQAFAAGEKLGERFNFDCLVYSGAHRTWQASLVMAAAAMHRSDVVELEKSSLFHFEKPFMDAFDGDKKALFAEIKEIKEKGGTLAVALEISKYARLSREQLTKGLLELAEEMGGEGLTTALVLCHSPYTEMAAVNTEEMPYGIGESDSVVYTIEDGEIINSELVKAPLKGKTLVETKPAQ